MQGKGNPHFLNISIHIGYKFSLGYNMALFGHVGSCGLSIKMNLLLCCKLIYQATPELYPLDLLTAISR